MHTFVSRLAAMVSLVAASSLPSGVWFPPLAMPSVASTDAGRVQSSLRSYPLVRIEATGLRRVTLAQIVRLCGLKAGTLTTQRDLQVASSRLAESGLFASVHVRTRMERYGLVVIFDVEEVVWSTPVFFDNFVDLDDETIRRAIRKDLPAFEGFAPDQPRVLMQITAAVQKLVRETEPSATVSYSLVPTSGARPRHYRFTKAIPGKTIRVCRIELAGLGDDIRENVALRARTLRGTDYSRAYAAQFAAESLVPAAQNGGYYEAKVVSVEALRGTEAQACASSDVQLRITFETGPPYVWTGAEWHGATALQTQELVELFAYPAGRPFDADRISRGLAVIQSRYERHGYLQVRVESKPRADSATQTISSRVVITEGVRFRMRDLRIEGLERQLAERILARWTQRPGEFFDGEHLAKFLSDTRVLEREALDGRTDIAVRMRSDSSSGMVDVTLAFSRSRQECRSRGWLSPPQKRGPLTCAPALPRTPPTRR